MNPQINTEKVLDISIPWRTGFMFSSNKKQNKSTDPSPWVRETLVVDNVGQKIATIAFSGVEKGH